MRVLGLETSCDETAAAVVEVDGEVDGPLAPARAATAPPAARRGRALSDVVHTQADVHARFGGVVPELASRDHLQRILPVVDEALERAGCRLADIDGLSVTSGPGLVGALLVGVQVARALALGARKPVVGVNHIEGHLLAVLLAQPPDEVPSPPWLGLVVSGGHTSLYAVRALGDYRALGHTLDDAAGEAFDKVARLLGLPYPGGAHIDRLAGGGDPAAIAFPRGLSKRRRDQFDFSFSGLKTAVLQHLRERGLPKGQALADLCASFQEAVCDALTLRAVRAARAGGLTQLVLCGGVAANSSLRERVLDVCIQDGLQAFIPNRAMCTDNAAMIGATAWYRLRTDGPTPLDIGACPNLRLPLV